jgi:hypothetical protein
MIFIPALVGKAKVFTFIYGGVNWPMLANMAVGFYYTSPIVAIYFFFSTQHQIAVGYYLFIYYCWGNLIYGVSVYEMLGLAIDRPLHQLLNLKDDVEHAENHEDYKLENYLKIFDTKNEEDISIKLVKKEAYGVIDYSKAHADSKERLVPPRSLSICLLH